MLYYLILKKPSKKYLPSIDGPRDWFIPLERSGNTYVAGLNPLKGQWQNHAASYCKKTRLAIRIFFLPTFSSPKTVSFQECARKRPESGVSCRRSFYNHQPAPLRYGARLLCYSVGLFLRLVFGNRSRAKHDFALTWTQNIVASSCLGRV